MRNLFKKVLKKVRGISEKRFNNFMENLKYKDDYFLKKHFDALDFYMMVGNTDNYTYRKIIAVQTELNKRGYKYNVIH